MSSLVVTEGTPTFDTLVNCFFFQTTGVLLTPFFWLGGVEFCGGFLGVLVWMGVKDVE